MTRVRAQNYTGTTGRETGRAGQPARAHVTVFPDGKAH
jgi:hypothetical protein